MRLPASFLLGIGFLAAQTPAIRREIPAGSKLTRVGIPIKTAPAPRDRLVARVSSDAIRTLLLTPDGFRINDANAESRGISWVSSPETPSLGSTDGGHTIVIEFTRPSRSGAYVLEFDASAATKSGRVEVEFISDRREYASMVRRMPGFQKRGPVVVSRSQAVSLELRLNSEEEDVILDVALSDAAVDVRLTLPGGRVITGSRGSEVGLEWKTLAKAEDYDPPESFVGLAGFLLREGGPHRVYTFATAKRGTYKIQAQTSGSSSGQVTAALIPVGRAFSQLDEEIEKLGSPPRGQTLLTLDDLPYSCFAGDRLELRAGTTGEPLKTPLNLSVKLEYRSELGKGPTGETQWGPPSVEDTEAQWTHTSDGRYRATVVPTRPGLLRVSVQATATTEKGRTFSQEGTLGPLRVSPRVANVKSIVERAVLQPSTDLLSRLDITATLDVLIPGEYRMTLNLENADRKGGTAASAQARLNAGEGSLTASVPSTEIRKRLRDGPWLISRVRIYRIRPDRAYEGDGVAVPTGQLKTEAYKREQWYHGESWGEETAAARGVHPAASGRFQMVEVSWAVTTPGGVCNLNGTLRNENVSIHSHSYGPLPRGRVLLPFIFDARLMSQALKSEWSFYPAVSCDFGPVIRDRTEDMTVRLDPSEFEPRMESTFLEGDTRWTQRGEATHLWLRVRHKDSRLATFDIGEHPAALRIETPVFNHALRDEGAFATKVTPDSAMPPGIYFVPVSATVGGETARTTLVIRVVP